MYYFSSHIKTIKMKNLFTTIILLFTLGLQAQKIWMFLPLQVEFIWSD